MTTLFKVRLTPTFLLLLGLTFLVSTISIGQQSSIFDIMHFEEVLEMTIEADLDSLKNSRRTDDYQGANLTFKDEQKTTQTWKIELRTRGKFRRQLCEMPPLKIKFKKASLAAAGLNKFNDMKLVTHCVADKEEAKQLLMKEFLTYQIYERLTAYSYRTQLVRITYKDIKTGKKTKNWGFLIEDTAQLADRIQAEKCDCWGNTPKEFHHGTAELVAMFEYMIGNEDYKFESLKNVKTFRKDGKLIAVPYDFDFSGLVNASYAIPNIDYQLKYVTDRVYLGSAESLLELHSTQTFFYAKEQQIKEVVHRFRKLDANAKLMMTAYLDDFFQNVEAVNLPKSMVKLGYGKSAVAK